LAGVAQLVEQLICNQQVGGSNPSTSSKLVVIDKVDNYKLYLGDFPSGQRGQTVNLLLFSFDGSNPSSPTTKSVLPFGNTLFCLSMKAKINVSPLRVSTRVFIFLSFSYKLILAKLK
jgi:hypothetical protein